MMTLRIDSAFDIVSSKASYYFIWVTGYILLFQKATVPLKQIEYSLSGTHNIIMYFLTVMHRTFNCDDITASIYNLTFLLI